MTAPTACLKRAVLCCLLSIMAISTHSAANLFVDDDDPTCGSVLPCFSRIQAAIDAAHAGDTVRVRPGTYQENVSIRKDLDLSSTGGPGSTIIDGADGGASTILVYSDLLDVRTRIIGFTIQHGSGITNFLEEGYGIAIYGFHHISVVIENNVIRDNNVSGGIGVFPVGPECDVTIAGNTIVHNGGLSGGVLVDSHYAGDYSATIANNVIAYNTAGLAGGGILLQAYGSFEVVNNTVYGNSAAFGGGIGVGIVVAAKLTNNILFNNSAQQGRDLIVDQVHSNPTVSFNIIGDGPYGGVNGNISQDPNLVAPQTGDFHITPQSIAVDAGSNVAVRGTMDFEGDARISDGNGDGTAVVDMGADEFLRNHRPVANMQPSGPVECSGADGAVLLDGRNSVDVDSTPATNDDIVSFEWYEDYGTPLERRLGAGPLFEATLGLGTHALTLKVTDRAGETGTASESVTVVDTTPPVIECPASPLRAECSGPGGTFVNLIATAHDLCGGVEVFNGNTAEGGDASGVFPVGSSTVDFAAIDASGLEADCSTTVEVGDTTAPALTLRASPAVLWPPNHRMVPVDVSWAASDVCAGDSVSVQLLSATSNEPDGRDIQGATLGTADGVVSLRAERDGSGSGRVYTLTYQAIDGAGNVTQRVVTVTVPLALGGLPGAAPPANVRAHPSPGTGVPVDQPGAGRRRSDDP